MWLGSSVEEFSHGDTVGSSPGQPGSFSAPVTFCGSVLARARAAISKGSVSFVLAWFRADTGTTLIKQGGGGGVGISVVECSHGKRETLGSSPGRATFFFRPCYISTS